MSLRVAIKCRLEGEVYYYFGRVEGRLVGAAYCFGEVDYITVSDVPSAAMVSKYGRLYIFEQMGKPREVFRSHGCFKPLCTPPVQWGGGFSRWWGFGYVILRSEFGDVYVTAGRVVTENFELVEVRLPWLFDTVDRCGGFGRGSGVLTGVELPVVRRRFGYLRVGGWLAWHRVLGLLDDGRWVLVGDDGLYEAVFTPTVKNPLEDFGEVGYVKVVGPFGGDPNLVQSPCGAPRLVACGEEGLEVGRAVLRFVRRRLDEAGVAWERFVGDFRCSESFIFPELVEAGIPAEVIHNWPLTDPCPHVLKAADGEPYGLFTPETHLPWLD